MMESLEQKMLDAAERYAVVRKARAKGLADQPAVTAAGIAAMERQVAERQARQEQVVRLAVQLDGFIKSPEGIAAMRMLRECGRAISFVNDDRSSDRAETSYEFCSDGLRIAVVNSWTDKERRGSIDPLDVARAIIAADQDPEEIIPLLRDKLIQIADMAPKL